MAAIKNGMQWLGELKASQLHQLAVALGSACSGSKGTVADAVRQTLATGPLGRLQTSSHAMLASTDRSCHLNIVSIDMGIQNLAYAHILAPLPNDRHSERRSGAIKLPVLGTWDRLTAFPAENQDHLVSKSPDSGQYSPSRYASAAYHFITDILTRHDPTHILIEQQRFRSGGSAAVAEWTIRVGVFEGMLHAILRTLREERQNGIRLQTVVSINPARTSRFWLERSGAAGSLVEPRKITGREGKQAKIDIVGKSFLNATSRLVDIGRGQAKSMETAFTEKWCASSKVAKELGLHKKAASSKGESGATMLKQPKLDDLADCLLQALAWLRWQEMRQLVLQDSNSEDPLNTVRLRLEELAQTKPLT